MLRGGFNHRALIGEVILVVRGIGTEKGIGLRRGEEIIMSIHMVLRGEVIMVWWIGMVIRREFSKVKKEEIGVGIVVGESMGIVVTKEGAKRQRETIGKAS